MNNDYFRDKSGEMGHIEKFLLCSAPSHMILEGEKGSGKSTLLYETLKKYSGNRKFRIISKAIDNKPIVVNLLELAEITCAAIGKSEFCDTFSHAIYEGVTHYLTRPLSGDTSAEARVVFEQVSSKKTSEIIDIFCNEFQKSLMACDYPILVLLDFQSDKLSPNCEYFIQSITNQSFMKHKFLIALRANDFLELVPDLHVLLPVQPFSQNEFEQLIKQHSQYKNVSRKKLWEVSDGNPLKYHLVSVVAARESSIIDDVKELLLHVVETEDDVCKKILLILSVFQLSLELDKLSSCLGIETDLLKSKIISSNLLLLAESSTGAQLCSVIHPSVYQDRTSIEEISPEISKKMLKWFLPELPFFDTYGYYANNPYHLFARLDILQFLQPESFIEFITSAPIRSLMRQWGASECAKQYLLSAIAICSRLAINSIQKARIYRDLAYHSKLMGQLSDFNLYNESFFREIETEGETDSISYVNAVLQTTETIIERANFSRQEGNYGEAIALLFEVQNKLDFLLELSPKNRTLIESELARIFHNLGIVYRDQAVADDSNVDMMLIKKSISCFEESLEIESLHENLPGKIAALSQLSIVSAMMEDSRRAKKYFSNLMADATSIGEDIIVADTAGNIAAIYLDAKSGSLWEEGLFYGKIAVTIYSQKKIKGSKKLAEQIISQLSRKLRYGKEN